MVLKTEIDGKEDTTPIRKIGKFYSENGSVRTMSWIGGILFKRVINIRKFCVFEKSLSDSFPFIEAKADVTFRIAESKDIELFRDILKPWNNWSKILKKRFVKRQTCIICFHANLPIGYIWISIVPETDRNMGLTVQPGHNETYGFDLFVLPEYRKFLIGYELISRWLKYSKESGKSRVIGVVEEYNKPMQIATKVVFGFKLVKKCMSIEFFNKRGFIISSTRISPAL